MQEIDIIIESLDQNFTLQVESDSVDISLILSTLAVTGNMRSIFEIEIIDENDTASVILNPGNDLPVYTLRIPRGYKGLKGDKGDKGDPFEYSDFTTEQLALLKGADGKDGEKGDIGEKGDKGEKGEKGEKGSTGDKGDKGNSFVYSDFTPTQLLALKGSDGNDGAKGDKGDTGEKGDIGEKGEKGDPFVFSDFTTEQLESLKGEKGDKGDVGDKGEKGDTGSSGDTGIGIVNTTYDPITGTLTLYYSDGNTFSTYSLYGVTLDVNINFIDVVSFVYNVPQSMIIREIQFETSAPTLSIPINTAMDRYTKLTITPGSIGLVTLKGVLL